MIYILKEETESDEYTKILSSYSPKFLPVLDVELMNVSELAAKLTSSNYSALVLTSNNSCAAIKETGILNKSLTYYCVGPRTAKSIQNLGLTAIGDQAGNAQALSEIVIADHQSNSLPLLVLQGDKALDTIPKALEQNQIKFDTLRVYSTKNVELSGDVIPDGSVVVLFSPSGLDSFQGAVPLNCSWIAIGKTSGAALEAIGCSYVVSSRPSASGVYEALQLLLTDEKIKLN